MKSPRSPVLLLVLYLHLEVHGEPEAAPSARTSGAENESVNVLPKIGDWTGVDKTIYYLESSVC